MALGRGRILIPGFIRFPPTLAVYGVAYSRPLCLGIIPFIPTKYSACCKQFFVLASVKLLFVCLFVCLFVFVDRKSSSFQVYWEVGHEVA